MPAARKPANEVERIEALKGYDILDTLPEHEYDAITKLASIICDTPIALVSIVDSERQWFKSTVGLDAKETPRELAFCAHAILTCDEILVVADAAKDPRFADNALVTDAPNIRFYAGFPLNTPSGHALGTLCAIDTKPKTITPNQKEALEVLATNVVSLLELRKSKAKSDLLIEKLQESNEDLERFAYVASHDLQEPLRMISNFTELLEGKLEGLLDGEAQEYLDISRSSAQRMQMLIKNLLDYACVNEGAEICEHIDCNRVMEYVVANLQEAISAKGAEVTYGELPSLTGNAVRISGLLQNLVGNALKYQAEGRQPIIHVSAVEEDTHWLFCVKDNGIGMKSEHLDRVFLPFERLHSEAQYSGTGIGLAICCKIVERMGGRIWVESVLGKGSSFYFTIPKNMCLASEG